MKNDSGIILAAVPFAAGTAAAAVLSRPFEGALAGNLMACALLTISASSGKSPAALLPAMFLLLGFSVWCSASLCGRPQLPVPGLMDTLCVLIADTDFPGEDSSALITALLTGRRSGLSRETVEAFRRSGAAHILALSGLHLGVIYVFICRLLSPLGNSPASRWMRGILSISFCGLYTLSVGAGPSVVRAFLFIVINEVRKECSARRSSPLSTYCTALTIQLTVDPLLIASPGFQLSYAAMLGIIILVPTLKNWYPEGGTGLFRKIWTAAALSISCQLFTAPLSWWHFRSLPKYFLLANLISLPLAEALIISSLVCLMLQVAGLCPQILAQACGKLAQLLVFCLETIASM